MYCVRFASNNASDDTFHVPYILYTAFASQNVKNKTNERNFVRHIFDFDVTRWR